MIVRAITNTGDWTFGQSKNNYKHGNAAVAQLIKTRLQSFLGDCFFDLGGGINWFNFLGGKDEIGLNLAISAVILNTPNVLSLTQLSISLNAQRACSISYTVQTSYSTVSNIVTVAV